MIDSEHDDPDVPRWATGPLVAVVPFIAVLKQPKLLLLSLGVPLAIGLAVGVAASSAFVGAGACVVALLGPALILSRLTTKGP